MPSFRHGVFHIQVLDARSARPVTELPFESIDGVGLAFGRGFDATVRQVPHPAVQALAAGGAFRKKPKPDALHAAADQKPTRDSQQFLPFPPLLPFLPYCGAPVLAGSGLSGSAFNASSFCR